jgi:hypothetical protein
VTWTYCFSSKLCPCTPSVFLAPNPNHLFALADEDDFRLATNVGQRSRRCALLVLRAAKFLEMMVAREEAIVRLRSVALSRSSLKWKERGYVIREDGYFHDLFQKNNLLLGGF